MDPVTLIIVAAACVGVGYAAGILITLSSSKKESQKAEAAVENPTGIQVEIARFYRENPGEPLRAEIDEKVLTAGSELNLAQRNRLEEILLELRSWLGLNISSPALPENPPAQIPSGKVEPFSLPGVQPLPPLTAGLLGKPAAQTVPQTLPYMGAKTIVAQIDDILQDKLLESAMAGRVIRLAESLDQGVVVQVDHDQYPDIDAVPDPDIRNLIRQAVSTWEFKAR